MAKNPKRAFYILIFSFPLKSLYVWVGADIQIWKLISLAFLLRSIPRLAYGLPLGRSARSYVSLIYLFIFYVVLITAVNTLILDETTVYKMIGGFFKNEGRILFQLMFFAITMNLIFIPLLVIRSASDAITSLRIFLYALVFLGLLGVVQYVVFHLVGFDLFPIQNIDGTTRSGFVLGIRDTVFRVNSIAGESKHLAVAMVFGITILLLCKMNNFKIVKYENTILIMFLFNLLSSFSTTGIVWASIALVMLIIIRGVFEWKSILLVLCVSAIGITSFFNLSEVNRSAVEKQAKRSGFEVQDETILEYFIDQPFHAITGVGLGNIHHYSVKYFPPSFPLFRNRPYKANSGVLYMLADFGLIGMCLLYIPIYLSLRRNIRVERRYPRKEISPIIVISRFTLIVSVLFLARYNELLFICFGLSLSLNSILERNLVPSHTLSKRQRGIV
ncbi:MAG: hypothetical protein DRR42_06410 [Gammaproteobacteria bacterium]|nr:MAG: hypothetical protein DRR42_06410 [Gammaproteobacteria bacterium]